MKSVADVCRTASYVIRRGSVVALPALLSILSAALAAEVRAQPVRLTANDVEDVPLAGEPAFAGQIYVSADSRLYLLGNPPDATPIGPVGATADRAVGGRAFGVLPASVIGAGHTSDVAAVFRGTYPIPLQIVAGTWKAWPTPCEADDRLWPVPWNQTYGGPNASDFGTMTLFAASKHDTCANPAAGGTPCTTPPFIANTDLFASDGDALVRLTADCGSFLSPASYVGGLADAGHVAWFGVVDHGLTGGALKDFFCGVYLDRKPIVEVPYPDGFTGPQCPSVAGFHDDTILIQVGDGANLRYSVSRGGAAPVPLEGTPFAELLRGGQLIISDYEGKDGNLRYSLVDKSNARHVLFDAGLTPGVFYHAGLAASDAAGRFVWVEDSRALHLWENGADRVIPTPGVDYIVHDEGDRPVLAGGRIALVGYPVDGAREIYLYADGTVARVTNNDFDDEHPVLDGVDGKNLFWVGRPLDPDGGGGDAEIYTTMEPLPIYCAVDGLGQALGEVQLSQDRGAAPPLVFYADKDGCAAVDPSVGAGTIRVTLHDRRNLLRVYYDAEPAKADLETKTVWFDVPLPPAAKPSAKLNPIRSTDALIGALPATMVDQAFYQTKLMSLAQMYAYTQRAARWSQEHLFSQEVVDQVFEDTGERLWLGPVRVVGYHATEASASAYTDFDDEGQRFSVLAYSRDGSHASAAEHPDNAEWHEYGHHIQGASLMGGAGFIPPNDGCAFDHRGLLNGSSAFSFTEAWAEFFSSVLQDQELTAAEKITNHPWVYTAGAGDDLDMNLDRLDVWRMCGLDEEIAIAAALWTIYRDDRALFGPLWQTLNRDRTEDVATLYAGLLALYATDVAGTKRVNDTFQSHGLCQNLGNNCACDPGETLGAPAHDLAFALPVRITGSTDAAGNPVYACWQLPATGDCSVSPSGYVVAGQDGAGEIGSLPGSPPVEPVCVKGADLCDPALAPATNFFALPAASPDFGKPTQTMCDGLADAAVGLINESQILVLPAPDRRRRPDDLGAATVLSIVDGASGAELPEAYLASHIVCSGVDAARSRDSAGPVRGLPRPFTPGAPRGACTIELTVTAPGYAPSAPKSFPASDVAGGRLPDRLVFTLTPSSAAARPTIVATAAVSAGSGGDTVTLHAEVSGGVAPYRVFWQTGDGALLEGVDVIHPDADRATVEVGARAYVFDGMGQLAVAGIAFSGSGDAEEVTSPDGADLEPGAEVASEVIVDGAAPDGAADGAASDGGCGCGGGGVGGDALVVGLALAVLVRRSKTRF